MESSCWTLSRLASSSEVYLFVLLNRFPCYTKIISTDFTDSSDLQASRLHDTGPEFIIPEKKTIYEDLGQILGGRKPPNPDIAQWKICFTEQVIKVNSKLFRYEQLVAGRPQIGNLRVLFTSSGFLSGPVRVRCLNFFRTSQYLSLYTRIVVYSVSSFHGGNFTLVLSTYLHSSFEQRNGLVWLPS